MPLTISSRFLRGSSHGIGRVTLLLLLALRLGVQAAEDCWVYVGTYTGAKSKGIYRFAMDRSTGALRPDGLAAETPSPSFLAVHPSRKWIFAANEVGEFRGEKSGAVTSYSLDRATGTLKEVSQQSSRGSGPCHVTVDGTGRYLLVANYGAGSAAMLPVGTDGALSPATGFVQHRGSSVNPQRQEAPHAHSINVDRGNRFAVVADLGLDQVLIYRLDLAQGHLVPNDPPNIRISPGAGPRHLVFHPSNRFAYVINELHSSVTAMKFDAKKGGLQAIQTISSLPGGRPVEGNSTAEVQIHPTGRFLYGSNRGHNSIVVYRVDRRTGQLTYVENEPTQGSVPRNFGIDPSGRFLLAANQSSDSIVVFRIDPKTGALEPTGHRVNTPTPVCVRFVEFK